MQTTPVHRDQVPTDQTWDLSSLYTNQLVWEQDASQLEALIQRAAPYQGALQTSPENLLACLRLQDEADRLVSRLTAYAECRREEDVTDSERQALCARAQRLAARATAAFAFVATEVAALPSELLEHPSLAPYHRSFVKIAHTNRLSPAAVHAISSLRGVLAEPRTIWQQTLLGDVKPAPIMDAAGNEQPVTLQNFGVYLRSPDRNVRKAAYESMNRACLQHKQALTAAIAAAQRRDVALARLKGYSTALEAALDEHEVPPTVVDGLVQGALAAAPQLHRYLAWRAERLGISQVAPYDLSCPVIESQRRSYTWNEAWEILFAALAPLGSEYRRLLERARTERWCDHAVNQHKNHVPYCRDISGCHPFINIPWSGTAENLSVLAHELGHAIHSVLTQEAQSLRDSRYGGLLAETAATTNQMLLSQYLIRTASTAEMRATHVEDAMGALLVNFFYSAVLTELQVQMHQAAEREEPLTFDRISAISMDLFRRYYGDGYEVTVEGVGSQWLRVPQHFANFYSYQYVGAAAAGILCATALLEAGEPERERYLNLLRAGCSKPPLELLRQAGADLTIPAVVATVGHHFASLVDELQRAPQ